MGLFLRTLRNMTSEVIELIEMIFPEQTNHYGTLFGGNALKLMSKAAFLAAGRQARCAVVMRTCNRVDFLRPIALGEVLTLTARVTRTGRSSMTVEVEGRAETHASDQRCAALSGSFEMVAVNAQGRPQVCFHSKELS